METRRAALSSEEVKPTKCTPNSLEELKVYELCEVLMELGIDSLVKLSKASKNLEKKIEEIYGWNTYWRVQFERDFPAEVKLLGIEADQEEFPEHYFRNQYEQAFARRQLKQANINMDPTMVKLFYCVRTNDCEGIKEYTANIDLAKINIFMDVIDEGGNSLLGLAQAYARTEIVQFIYDRVCEDIFGDKYLKDSANRTRLFYAAACGLLEEVKKHCTSDNVDEATHSGMTPLGAALMFGELEIVKFLLTKKARLYYAGRSLLHIPVRYNQLHIVKYLLEEQRLSPRGMGADLTSPLYIAVRGNNLEMVEYLIQHGANVHAVNRDKYRETALYRAVKNNNRAIVACLLSHDAWVTQVTVARRGPMHIVKDPDIFRALLKDIFSDASLESQDKNGNTPLHLAVMFRPKMVQALLAGGAMADRVNKVLHTPLSLIVCNGKNSQEYLELARDLLEHGADVNRMYCDKLLVDISQEKSNSIELTELLTFWSAKQLSNGKPLNQQLIAVLNAAVTVTDTICSFFFSESIPTLIKTLGTMNGSTLEEINAIKELIKKNRKHISKSCFDFIDRYLLKEISMKECQAIDAPSPAAGVVAKR